MQQPSSLTKVLKKHGYKETEPRRLVLEAMERLKDPASPSDIHTWLTTRGHHVNAVTVYRVIAVLEQLHLVHRHPCDGTYSLCEHPEQEGQHFFLHCHDCGSIEEHISRPLARATHRASRRSGFHVTSSIAELTGTCRSCS